MIPLKGNSRTLLLDRQVTIRRRGSPLVSRRTDSLLVKSAAGWVSDNIDFMNEDHGKIVESNEFSLI